MTLSKTKDIVILITCSVALLLTGWEMIAQKLWIAEQDRQYEFARGLHESLSAFSDDKWDADAEWMEIRSRNNPYSPLR